MSRQLLLCRHADAVSASYSGPDFHRELSTLGLAQAQHAGEWISAHYPGLRFILASTAVRAYATARVIAAACALPDEAVLPDARLYDASALALLQVLSELPESCRTALLVAHNPGLNYLASSLSGHYGVTLGTAHVLQLQLDIPDWQHISSGCGSLSARFEP